MRVRRNNAGNILITLRCLNPNYASRAKLSKTINCPSATSDSTFNSQACLGGVCQWVLPNDQYDLILSVGATLIPHTENGQVVFEAKVEQGGVLVPTIGNSKNPERKPGITIPIGDSNKANSFYIRIV